MSLPAASYWSSQKVFRFGSFQTAKPSTDGRSRASVAMNARVDVLLRVGHRRVAGPRARRR